MYFSSIFLKFLIFLHFSHLLLLCYLLAHVARTYVTAHIRLNVTNTTAPRVEIQYKDISDTQEAHGPNICQLTGRKYLKNLRHSTAERLENLLQDHKKKLNPLRRDSTRITQISSLCSPCLSTQILQRRPLQPTYHTVSGDKR